MIPARRINRGNSSTSQQVSAPVGGWNARDGLPDMAPTDAVSLVNIFPTTTECALRNGYSEFATGISGQVESLMNYAGATSEKLYAIASGKIYDVTSGGAVGAAAVSGLTNSRFNYCNVTTSGGNFLYCANGLDKPYLFDGTTWTAIDGGSVPAITGVTTTTLKSPIVFKNRVWFIQKDTLKTWYLPTSAVGGAAAAVDMSAVAQLGGYIVAHCTWTIDAGSGLDDYYVAVTNHGEVIVYQGTDPSSSTTWSLKGVYRVGAPVGDRCLFKFAGDVLMISQDGVLPLASAVQSSRVNPRVALTDKIQWAVSEAVTSYGATFGWQVVYYAKANQLWMNVPVAVGNQSQYVMNTISRSWCEFQGWAANCWEIFQDQPYFGGNGIVGKAWDGNTDAGVAITGHALQAFNGYGAAGRRKRVTMARPVFRASGTPSISAAINFDFDTSDNTTVLSFTPVTYATWGSATWDVDVWGGALTVWQPWQGCAGEGFYAAPAVKIQSSGNDVRWVSTGLVMEVGGQL